LPTSATGKVLKRELRAESSSSVTRIDERHPRV
jgi:hypothetical protein